MSTILQKAEVANPFTFMRRVSEELDRALGIRPDVTYQPEFFPRIWSPELEVFERDDKWFVRVDLPGLKKEELKIEVSHDELTIEGERKLEKEERNDRFYRTERTYGRFCRRIDVPEHVKAENAVATFKDGVLEIQMPAIPLPDVKKRTVDIKD